MFSRIHAKLGTAGFIISIVALVAALGGGAYAASGGLNGKQKKEVEKIAKKYAGKPGKNGAPGATGAKGDAGAAGAKGDAGAQGIPGGNGSDGGPGAAGKSVVVAPEGPGPECGTGGISVEVEGTGSQEFVCNGEQGPPGNPWTAGGKLPSGATETGTWSISVAAEGSILQPLSFSLPLATSPEPILVDGDTAPGCPGVENGLPTAEAGKLCLYQNKLTVTEFTPSSGFLKPFSPTAPGAGPSGTILAFTCGESGPCLRVGAWAVTAP
jgi:hypothetical protein